MMSEYGSKSLGTSINLYREGRLREPKAIIGKVEVTHFSPYRGLWGKYFCGWYSDLLLCALR